MIELTDANFQNKVLENTQLTVVDFWAPWCAPCRTLLPRIETLAQKYEHVTFGKLNIDAYPAKADAYHVKSIPTLVFFLNGEEKERLIGLPKPGKIEEIIKQLSPST